MTVSEIIQILNAQVFFMSNGDESMQIKSACGSDMMSDVLAYVKDQGLLLTGLVNPQVVRTCEMMDIRCIVFVRGKKPDESIVELAKAKGMVLLSTNETMFSACGMLYKSGLMPGGDRGEPKA